MEDVRGKESIISAARQLKKGGSEALVKGLSTSTLSSPNSYDLMDFLSSFPHGGNARFIKTESAMEIKRLEHPIGLTVLPKSKNIVIGLTKKNEVHMYDPKGKAAVAKLSLWRWP